MNHKYNIEIQLFEQHCEKSFIRVAPKIIGNWYRIILNENSVKYRGD